MKFNKTIPYSLTLLGLSVIFQSVGAATDNTPIAAQIEACSLETLDSERLKCFDLLAQTLPNVDSQDAVTPAVLPETLGGGKFDKTNKTPKENQGVVTSCKKSLDGRWMFEFENGQVWKQSNLDRRSRRYKGCNFPVTIVKDGFGYKMHVEALSRKIRVKRLK